MPGSIDYTDLEIGCVYNSEYTGPNQAYAKINGKMTFLVLETHPKLRTIALFDQFGHPLSKQIKGNVVTHGSPADSFTDVSITEPADESEWFKKSVRFNSLKEALDSGLITIEDVTDMAERRNPSTPVFGADMNIKGVYYSFSVEDKTEQPLLQSVFLVWKDWEDHHADFASLGISIDE